MQGAAALSKHWALPCAQCHGVLRRILSRDCPVAGIRYNDATLKSLPRYRGLLAIALLSLARRMYFEAEFNFTQRLCAPRRSTNIRRHQTLKGK